MGGDGGEIKGLGGSDANVKSVVKVLEVS